MNTSAKGAAYERAFKRYLLDTRRAYEVTRAAASKGHYDLISVEADVVHGYQLKAGRMSCSMARRIADTLPDWPNFWGRVVHKTKEREFCEH